MESGENTPIMLWKIQIPGFSGLSSDSPPTSSARKSGIPKSRRSSVSSVRGDIKKLKTISFDTRSSVTPNANPGMKKQLSFDFIARNSG